MQRTKMGALALAFVSTLAVTAGGCATEPAEDEPQAESSAAIEACGQYPRNPACSAPLFLRAAWDLAVENAWDNAILPVANAVTCFSALRAAGAITGGIRAVAPALVSTNGALAVIGAVDGCKSLASYFDRIGIAQNISCFIEPLAYDESVHACLCRNDCRAQLGSSALGYLDNVGMRSCHCTMSRHDAFCRLAGGCGEWYTEDKNDPDYCTCRRPPGL